MDSPYNLYEAVEVLYVKVGLEYSLTELLPPSILPLGYEIA